jgi:uncharacterized membrane protein
MIVSKVKKRTTKIFRPDESTWIRKDVFVMLKNITIGLGIILLLIVVLIFIANKHSYQVTKASVATLVKENLVELVTNSTTTMVVCTIDDIPEGIVSKLSNYLVGESSGIFITKVKFSYGIDLKNDMSEEDIVIDDQYITITLPSPKRLHTEIDFDYKIVTKKTIFRALIDKITGVDIEKAMRIAFLQKVDEFAKENGLEPSKEEIINKIQPFFNKFIASQMGKQIIFK